jgi:hypothetical protein
MHFVMPEDFRKLHALAQKEKGIETVAEIVDRLLRRHEKQTDQMSAHQHAKADNGQFRAWPSEAT